MWFLGGMNPGSEGGGALQRCSIQGRKLGKEWNVEYRMYDMVRKIDRDRQLKRQTNGWIDRQINPVSFIGDTICSICQIRVLQMRSVSGISLSWTVFKARSTLYRLHLSVLSPFATTIWLRVYCISEHLFYVAWCVVRSVTSQ